MDGRRDVIGFVFPGDIMGLSARGRHIYPAEAVTNCYIYALPHEKLNTLLADSSTLREEFISGLGAEVSRTQSLVLDLRQKSAEERVASFILELAAKDERRLGEKAEVRMPMSHLDSADYLGLTVETVCRSPAKLKKVVHIRTIGRDVVLIERLADLRISPAPRGSAVEPNTADRRDGRPHTQAVEPSLTRGVHPHETG
jgi:CRP/FNR family transcriptional regulator